MSTAILREADLTNATWYEGSRYSYPIRGEDTAGTLAFLDVLKRKGTEPPPHIHHREHEMFVVMDGDTAFHAGSESTVGRKGAFAFLPSGVPHRFALESDWAKLGIALTPSGFEKCLLPFSKPATHMGEPPLPDAPLDIAALIASCAEHEIEFLPPGADLRTAPYTQPQGLRPIVRQRNEGELLNVLGIPVHVKVSKVESGGAVSAFMTTDLPGYGPPLHIHHNEDETFLVMEGNYKVRVGDTMHDVGPGQFTFFPRGVPHAYVNAGDAPGTLLVVCTPGGFEEYFRALDALARTGAPAEADVIRVSKEHGLDIIGPPIAV